MDQQRRQKAPTIAQELERFDSLSEPDQLLHLIRSRESRPLFEFPEQARDLIVALVGEPGFHSRDGVALDRGWGKDSTISIKVNTRIYLNELDGTFHEIEVPRPALVRGEPDSPSEATTRTAGSRESARRMIERFRGFDIVTDQLTAEDFLRRRTTISDLSVADRDRLLWEMRFGRAMSDMDAIHGLLADGERLGGTSVRVSAQVVITIADGSRTSIRAFSMP